MPASSDLAMQRRLALLLTVPGLLFLAACGDDDDSDSSADDPNEATDDTAGGEQGTIAVQLEPTESIFIEGFEVGLRFDDPASGDELDRVLWSEFVASLPPSDDPDVFHDSVLEQAVPAGNVRIGVDVNIGIGPGPEPPDLDAASLPCELDVEVPEGETVTVEVAFDDAIDDCLKVV